MSQRALKRHVMTIQLKNLARQKKIPWKRFKEMYIRTFKKKPTIGNMWEDITNGKGAKK